MRYTTVMKHKDLSQRSLTAIPVDCVAFNLGKAYRAVMRQFEEAFAATDISPGQYGLLVHIAAIQPASATSISEATGHDPSTLSRTLTGLISSGHLTQQAAVDGDKRKKMYLLTEQGETSLAAGIKVWRTTQQRIIRIIGKEEWAETLEGLRRLQNL